jgi:hypothetical protein
MRTQTHSSAAPAPEDTNSAVLITAVSERDQAGRQRLEPFGRIRRLRGDSDGQANVGIGEDETALELQVMLLSEENARLKAAQHRPSDLGTLIDQMRGLAAREGDGEVLDEAWTTLSECLVIREGLDRACAEIQSAIGDVRTRLAALTTRFEDDSAGATPAPGVLGPLDSLPS